MADFASKVNANQSAQFFARFGRFVGDDERATALLKRLLGDDAYMRSLVEPLLAPRVRLFQTVTQQEGGGVTLAAMIEASRYPWFSDTSDPAFRGDRLMWYLAHKDEIPPEWKGKFVYFPETMRVSGLETRVTFLYSYGGRWIHREARVDFSIGPEDFVAVPTE